MDNGIQLIEMGQPEPGAPERRDAAENRRRILQVAEALFAEQGVPNVNMADIAQEAGVGKGTLYRNFSNKGELCLALMDTQLKEFQDTQLAWMREQAGAGLPYMEQLAHFLQELVRFSIVHMPLLYEVQQAGGMLGLRDTVRPHFWQYVTVRGLLRNAMQVGELPPQFDADYMAEALLAPLAPHTFLFQRNVLGFDQARMASGLRLILDGLSALAVVPA